MRKKRVLISTMFENNYNYGGILQAYALNTYICNLGYDCKILVGISESCFRYLLGNIYHRTSSFFKHKGKIENIVCKIVNNRHNQLDNFKKLIPQTSMIYSNDIKKISDSYDYYITGSDQVWNPDWINEYRTLSFTKSQNKIAYAASVGRSWLSDEQQKKYKFFLKGYKAISLRENESLKSIQELSDVDVIQTLDPTLLLSESDWNEITSERIINEDYIFCYFLRGNPTLRKVASEYAAKFGYKLVFIPYMSGAYRKVDDGFGEHIINRVSPNDFLSYIKYAAVIFTDSFHGTVFSHIFKKQFYVINEANDETSIRMKSLTDLFGTSEHLLIDDGNINIETILNMKQIDYSNESSRFINKKCESEMFIKNNLDYQG